MSAGTGVQRWVYGVGPVTTCTVLMTESGKTRPPITRETHLTEHPEPDRDQVSSYEVP